MSDTHGISEKPEDLSIRRSQDRSEDPITLEEQLHTGLEDSFPASDPVAVVSPTISGKAKKLVGTDEILAQQRAARAALAESRHAERRRRDGDWIDGRRILGVKPIYLLGIGVTLAVGALLLAGLQDRSAD